jgi:NADH dehydrogenase (ubiquinone) 1 beta subcomplex subunit 7
MKANRVPLGFRDSCAHLLIPLNQCRLRSFYLPWKCEDERYDSGDC